MRITRGENAVSFSYPCACLRRHSFHLLPRLLNKVHGFLLYRLGEGSHPQEDWFSQIQAKRLTLLVRRADLQARLRGIEEALRQGRGQTELLNLVKTTADKTGPNGNLYVYPSEDTGDTSLHAPINSNNDKYYGLSHLSFCYDVPLTGELVPGDVLKVPVKHGEGQFVASPRDLERIEAERLVVFRYCSPTGDPADEANPNGASNAIAGIRNEGGNVVGLMPHPEHAVDPDVGATGGQPMFAALLSIALARAA